MVVMAWCIGLYPDTITLHGAMPLVVGTHMSPAISTLHDAMPVVRGQAQHTYLYPATTSALYEAMPVAFSTFPTKDHVYSPFIPLRPETLIT